VDDLRLLTQSGEVSFEDLGNKRGARIMETITITTLKPNPWAWEKASQKHPTVDVPRKIALPLTK
jgi:hypothetical protein